MNSYHSSEWQAGVIKQNQFNAYLVLLPNLSGWGGYVERNLGKGLHREDWERTMEMRETNLPCWELMRAVNVFCLAIISAVSEEIWSPRYFLSSLSFVSFNCVLSPSIETLSFRISSRISSRVAIASQFSPICQSSKSRKWNLASQMRRECSKNNTLSRYPKPNGYKYQNRWKNWPLGRFCEWQSKCRKYQIPPDNGR